MANRGNEGGQIDYCLDFLTRGTPLLLHGGPPKPATAGKLSPLLYELNFHPLLLTLIWIGE